MDQNELFKVNLSTLQNQDGCLVELGVELGSSIGPVQHTNHCTLDCYPHSGYCIIPKTSAWGLLIESLPLYNAL